MSEYLPQSLREELLRARQDAAAKRTRLRVEAAGESYRLTKLTRAGFSIAIEDAPKLRGLVDLFEGGRHLSQCLIVAAAEDGDQMVYEFKRNTAAHDGAPLDFERAVDAPIALLGR